MRDSKEWNSSKTLEQLKNGENIIKKYWHTSKQDRLK